jgi:hypothetical protein
MKKILLWRKLLKKKHPLTIKLWSPSNLREVDYDLGVRTNPWFDEIGEYLESSVFPCIRAEVERIVRNQADISLRWLWERPWEIHGAARSTIKTYQIRWDDPTHFIGGVGFWQISINDHEIREDDFVLITAWDNEDNQIITNFSIEQFANLLGSTMTTMPPTRIAPPASFNVKEGKETKREKTSLYAKLRSDMEGGLKSLGYKKIDVDWDRVDAIIDKVIKEGNGTIEECIQEFLVPAAKRAKKDN